jgi:hypothetical protein
MIANAYFVSIGITYSHINSIYKKLHANSKPEAVIKVMKERPEEVENFRLQFPTCNAGTLCEDCSIYSQKKI